MQEWAPQMLFNPLGEPHLSWIVIMSAAKQRCRLGLSDAQYHAFVREWPASEEGRRLLEGLRWATGVEGGRWGGGGCDGRGWSAVSKQASKPASKQAMLLLGLCTPLLPTSAVLHTHLAQGRQR